MQDFIDLSDDPAISILLDAYRVTSKATTKELQGWVPRIAAVEGLADDDVARAHGTAIAADLLEIRVEDTTSGLRYRPRKAA